jgi:hypothetical protein
MNTNSTITRLTGAIDAIDLSTNLVLSLSAVSLAALVTACGAETHSSDPVTRSDTVVEAPQNYAGDPWEQRFVAGYYSDRALSDAWQRHPELLRRSADTTDGGRPPARPGVQHHTAGPYDQDPSTSAEAWTRRLEAVQGASDQRSR